jgi:hypothetical protein
MCFLVRSHGEGARVFASANACISGTRVDEPGVSYDDAWVASYWVPEVPAPESRGIWLIRLESPWNKSNSSVVGSGTGSGAPWVGRSAVGIQVNYTYLNELNWLKLIKLKIPTNWNGKIKNWPTESSIAVKIWGCPKSSIKCLIWHNLCVAEPWMSEHRKPTNDDGCILD